MDDSLKESITLALKERLSSPLWGYILLSWTGFNWQNIATLFMSKKTVEERINVIIQQDWFYVHFLVTPLILGVFLAIISPYLKQWLSAAHKRADKRQRQDMKQKIIDKYDDDIAIVEKKLKQIKLKNLLRKRNIQRSFRSKKNKKEKFLIQRQSKKTSSNWKKGETKLNLQ